MGLLERRYGDRAFGRSAGQVVLLVALSAQAAGQTLGTPAAPGGPAVPGWLTRWSAIGLVADLPRDLPGEAVSLPDVLTVPAPRVGTFWTAGNPAGLATEVSDSYSQIRLGYSNNRGTYRRPLDPGRERRIGGTAFGWTDLAANGAAIGRIVVEHVGTDHGSHADVVLPHSSNPFVVLDTLGDAVAGMVARLEGAGGWSIGPLGLGGALAYDGREMRTAQSPAPRQYRVSAAGGSAGLTYDLPGGALQVGAYGRLEQLVQEFFVYSYYAPTRIYALSGYFDPLPLDVENTYYQRRFERTGHALGGSLSGRIAGARWAVFGQSENLAEHQSVLAEDEPPTDDWDTEGWSAGFAAQVDVGDSLLSITVAGEYSTLTGRADRMDLEEINFEADETGWRLGAEVRLVRQGPWSGALRLGTGREDRRRYDYLARVGSDLSSWIPGATVDVARALASGFSLSVGFGYTHHAPWGSLPDPSRMDAAYQDWIAPELAVYGTTASGLVGTASLLWRGSDVASFWVRGSASSVAPASGIGSISDAPEGSREHGSLEVGVTWGVGR